MLKAGRDLDALVAEKVMGLKPCTDPVGRCEAAHMTPPQCWGDGRGGTDLQSYSEYMSDAWQIIEHFKDDQWDVRIKRQNGIWWVEFCRPSYEFGEWAETFPLAICKAALGAVTQSSADG